MLEVVREIKNLARKKARGFKTWLKIVLGSRFVQIEEVVR